MSDAVTSQSAYAAIAAELRRKIGDGTYPEGSRLPTEDKLAAHYGVTRPTVNRAVQELRRDSLVEVRRGVGTFVTSFGIPVTRAALGEFLLQRIDLGDTVLIRYPEGGVRRVFLID